MTDIAFLIGGFVVFLVVMYILYDKIDDIELANLHRYNCLNKKLNDIEANIKEPHTQNTESCNKCGAPLKILKYYYDDDWGVQGSKVFDVSGKDIGSFAYCPTCGTVKIVGKILE